MCARLVNKANILISEPGLAGNGRTLLLLTNGRSPTLDSSEGRLNMASAPKRKLRCGAISGDRLNVEISRCVRGGGTDKLQQ